MQQINWHLGQAVLPEHFTLSQQLSTQRNISLCQTNSATGFYGLAELTVDESLLEKYSQNRNFDVYNSKI